MFFVFILPAILRGCCLMAATVSEARLIQNPVLVALAWLFYGTNSMSLEAILRPPSFLSSSYGSPRHALPIAA